MRAREREKARMKLDKELRYYRLAAREKNPTRKLLRAVREVLHIPVEEIAGELGVNRSVLYRLEQAEDRGTISLNSMARVAQAMNCRFFYAVLPRDEWTLEELAEWRRLRKKAERQGVGNRE